jgi:hypothetical protein
MKKYQLTDNLYIAVTPAGAFYAASMPDEDPSRHLLRQLLKEKSSPLLEQERMQNWTNFDNADESMELLYHVQNLGLVEGLDAPLNVPQGALEDIVPGLLTVLSESGKALLADAQGFYITSQGFAHEAAEELSALSADLASLHERHRRLLQNNLGLGTSAWALIDASGNSQVGFWPLFVGEQRFVLIVGGVPHLNQPELSTLVWALSTRYGM